MRVAIFLPALVLLTLAPIRAAAQEAEVPTVAVLDFTATSLSPGFDGEAVGSGLAAMITTELANRPEVQVVDRQRIRELIETRQLAATGRMDADDAIRLGQLLGAQYIVIGHVWVQGDQARLDLRLLDTFTGATEKASKRTGDPDDFLAVVAAVADDFTDGLEGRVRVAEAQVEPPAEAVLAYSRGLNYERRRMTDRAVEMYRKALELFPEHEAAAAALRRVSARGGSR